MHGVYCVANSKMRKLSGPQNICWTDSQRRSGNATETRNKQLQRDASGGGVKIRVTPLLGRKSEREFWLQKQRRNSSRNAREEHF